ncbi:MAG: hypothetical protein RLZZ221_3088, partial [Verrucomicrobiota bacterium]
DTRGARQRKHVVFGDEEVGTLASLPRAVSHGLRDQEGHGRAFQRMATLLNEDTARFAETRRDDAAGLV